MVRIMKETNFDRRISRATALDLIKPINQPDRKGCVKDEIDITIMCKEYGDDDDWIGIEASDYDNIEADPTYQTFEIWF